MLQKGDAQKALTRLRALAANEGSMASTSALVWRSLAEAHAKAGSSDADQLNCVQTALRLDPDPPDDGDVPTRTALLLTTARVALAAQKYKEAKSIFMQLLVYRLCHRLICCSHHRRRSSCRICRLRHRRRRG